MQYFYTVFFYLKLFKYAKTSDIIAKNKKEV